MEAMTLKRVQRGGEMKALGDLIQWKGSLDPEPTNVTGDVSWPRNSPCS